MHSTMPLDVEKDLLSQLLQRYERATGFNPAPHWKFARVFAEFRVRCATLYKRLTNPSWQ